MHRGLLALFVLLTSCGPEFSGEAWTSQRSALTSVTGFGSNPGGLTLSIHEPAGLGSNVPLVVAMHGCSQTADGYVAAGWNTLADQHRFLVAYPQTTGNAGCFDWFSSNQQTRSGAQVTSILQMVQHLVTTRGVDPSRVYVTGLSAGGAMTGVLLAVAPDVFSRGAIMSALPFACATSQLQGLTCMNSPPDQTPAQWGALVRAVSGSNAAPRVSIWHGTSDSTVRIGNLQEQVDQWTDVNAIDVTADVTTTIGIATRREFKNASGLTLVESWSLAGMGHGTAIDVSSGCGTASAFILDVDVCSTRFAAEFFGLTSTSDAGVPSPDAGVVVPDAGSPDAGSSACLGEWFATNVSHFNSGRAVLCSGRYCAVGSGDLLGDSLDMTWVRQTGTTRFEAGRCSVQPDAGVGGGSGGGSATGGGSGTTGGGSGTTGGGGSATGGSGSATGGGGNATGGGGGAANPSGCGCVSVEPIALSLIALYLVRRRRQTT